MSEFSLHFNSYVISHVFTFTSHLAILPYLLRISLSSKYSASSLSDFFLSGAPNILQME